MNQRFKQKTKHNKQKLNGACARGGGEGKGREGERGGEEWQLWVEEKTRYRKPAPRAGHGRRKTLPDDGATRQGPGICRYEINSAAQDDQRNKIQQGVVQLVWESHPLKNSASVPSKPLALWQERTPKERTRAARYWGRAGGRRACVALTAATPTAGSSRP